MSGTGGLPAEEMAVPTLKVMRLQKPELHAVSSERFETQWACFDNDSLYFVISYTMKL
jgi:hypothetical protein